MTAITFPDGTQARYQYITDSAAKNFGFLYQVYDTESDYGVTYTHGEYYILGTPRLLYVKEFTATSEPTIAVGGTGDNRNYGFQFHGYRNSRQMTSFRFYGSDRQRDTADDTIEYCLLDFYGRTVTNYTTDSAKEAVKSIASAKYTETSGTSKTNNRMERAGSGGVNGINRITNGGFEQAEDISSTSSLWQKRVSGSGVNAANGTPRTSDPAARTGARYLRIYTPSSSTNAYVGAHYQVALPANTTYTLSAYVNTTAITTFGSGGGMNLYVMNGSSIQEGELLSVKTNAELDNGWQRLTYTFTTTNAGTYSVGVQMKNATGYAFADDVQLEVGESASNLNLLQNGSFDVGDASSEWEMEGSYFGITTGVGSSSYANGPSGNALYIVGSLNAQRKVGQTVMLNAPAGSTFLISGWAKANAAPSFNTNTTSPAGNERFFGLYVVLVYTDNSTEPQYFPANTDVTGWQYISGTVVPKEANMGKTISSIQVWPSYHNNFENEVAYFDDLSLRMEPVQTYKYDSEGNLIKTTQTENAPESYSYSGADLTQYVSGGNGTFTYTYDSKHNLTSATNDTVKMTLTNNTMGLTTKVTLADATATYNKSLQSTATYGNNGQFLVASTDVDGRTTQYGYNVLGQLLETVAPSGTRTQTTYTQSGYTQATTPLRPKQTYISNVISVQYNYDTLGRLSFLERGSYPAGGGTKQSQYYGFTYDTWGNATGIGIANSSGTITNTLATYTYANGNGLLTRMTFGNGSYVQYTYDLYERLTQEQCYNKNGALTQTKHYVYNSEGILSETYLTNASGAVTQRFRFEYDSLGRLIRSNQTDGNVVVQSTEHIYDENNRLTKQNWRLGETDYSQTYTYNNANGNLTHITNSREDNCYEWNFTYDNLQRVTNEQFTGLYNRSYTFRDQNEDYTTTQVTKVAYTAADYGDSSMASQSSGDSARTSQTTSGLSPIEFLYEYDEMGNISRTVGPVGPYTWPTVYEYDEQNQLISASWPNQQFQYIYDTAGNIVVAQSDAYGDVYLSYSSTNGWRDLLYSVEANGDIKEIRYETDAEGNITGNPTRYYNGDVWNFTWQNGRELATASGSGYVLSYTYGVDGVRTSKTVNGVRHDYLTQNGKVVQETWTSNGTQHTMEFVYDNLGRPSHMYYDGTPYYFKTNSQGDVIYVCQFITQTDQNGDTVEVLTPVGRYLYDPWGRPLSNVRMSRDAANVTNLNPIRYRGYYWDAETGFYYLQSRYYDPVICRFINADGYASTGVDFLGYNMFAYCNNNPVDHKDSNGEFLVGALVKAGLGAAKGITLNLICYFGTTSEISGRDIWKNVFTGAITGAVDGLFNISEFKLGIRLVYALGSGILTGLVDWLFEPEDSRSVKTSTIAGASAVVSTLLGLNLDAQIPKGEPTEKAMSGLMNVFSGATGEIISVAHTPKVNYSSSANSRKWATMKKIEDRM